MPILDARHDLAHPVEGDSAWSESYYFNAYDPGTDSGLFSRIGIRPNEGTMDVGLSLWLPDGQLGEYRWVKEQREMVDSVLEVGAVRYEMLEALQSWRLTMEGEVQARPCVRGETATRPVPVALDVRFDAVTPAIGTDGQPSGGPKSAEAAAAAGTVGKGHLEQAGRWTGALTVDGTRHEWHGAHGNRDRSWGPRRWGGPKMWRWFSINIGEDMHFGGIRLGTDAGDLHRGLGVGRHAGHLGGRVARADRADRRRGHPPCGPPRRGRQVGPRLPAARRRAAGGRHRPGRGHHGQRGAGPLDLRGPGGPGADRLRDLRVPAPARRRREACRPRRVGMAPRRSTEELAGALGRRLDGTVRGLRRLSGGASRVTSAFELETPGHAPRPLILQMDRGVNAPSGRVRTEAALLRAAHDAGVPVPGVVALGEGDDLGASWLVVERIEGETIPRKILRDDEWAGARRALTAQVGRALAAIHTIDPGAIDGLAPSDPLGDPLPFLDGLGEVRPALELGVRWLAAHRPPDGPRVAVHGDYRMGNLLVGPDGLRGVLDWELAHTGDPAEDVGWLCAPAWRFGGTGEVGGFGALDELLAAYAAAGGGAMTPDRVHWWQVYATVKWATICALQASVHLSGAARSVELATIGRRVCESEWDLFGLLGTPPPGDAGPAAADAPTAPFGRPTATELVEAVREYLDGVMERSEGGAGFEARVARNALGIAERELRLGPALAAAHAARVAALGFADDAALATALRSGVLDDDWESVAPALAAAARDQLLVANPAYLPAASG